MNFGPTMEDTVEGMHTLNSVLNGVYRIFFLLDLEPFFHYTELVPEAPKTWDELITFGKDATNADEEVWGWRPTNGVGHEFNTVLLMQPGGGPRHARRYRNAGSLQFMQDWVFTHGSPQSTTSEGSDQIQPERFGQSRRVVELHRRLPQHSNTSKACSPWKRIPAALADGSSSDIGLIHGWGWMLPSWREKDLAIEYLNWFSRPVLKKFIVNVHRDAPALFVDQRPDVIEAVPTLALPVGWETILAGAKFRRAHR